MDIKYLASKNVAVLGMGIEGIALSNFLIDKCRKITLLDRKSEDELLSTSDTDQQIELKKIFENGKVIKQFGENYLDGLDNFDIVFRSPGIKYLLPEIQRAKQVGVEISSQIKLFFDLCPSLIIGVTGTKGKGTTSSLIYQILKNNQKINLEKGEISRDVYLTGNIGTPAISLLETINPEDFTILELSSFQLQDLHKSPHIAVVLNVSSDHLDYHQSNEEYLDSKSNIVKYQTAKDFAIINQDYLNSIKIAENTAAKNYFFSGKNFVEDGAFVRQADDGNYEVLLTGEDHEDLVCRSNELKIFGKHNMENIAAAALAAKLCGINLEIIKNTVKEFKGLPHRLEFVAEIGGTKIFNDSFSTNPDPAIAAIKSFTKPKIIMLGGSTKGADFHELASEIVKNNVKAVILIGDEAANIRQSLDDNYYDGVIINSGYDFSLAVAKAMECAKDGDVILFSPACASFDMFKNYKDRGNKFKDLINSYAHASAK